MYAFGLRRREACGLDVADLRHNPKAPGYGEAGALFVRWGKSSHGSPPKRRTVLKVPEMDWVAPVLGDYVTEVRPLLGPGKHPALWVTERCGRMSPRGLNRAFGEARDLAGSPGELDLHALRHSYVTGGVRLPGAVRPRPGRVRVCIDDSLVYRGVGARHGDLWEDRR